MSHINFLSDEDFIRTFGNLVENCPFVAATVVSSRPFSSIEHLHTEICCVIDELPVKGENKKIISFLLFLKEALISKF